jgi:cysteine-rich secretory family protein
MKRAAWTVVIPALVLMNCAYAQDSRLSNNKPEQHLFQRLNQERQIAGLPSLQWDNHLAQAALVHAKLLAKHEDLSHQFPGESSLMRRIAATGLRFTSSAENIATVDVADDAHVGWMLSPGHRANILSPEYNRVGIGIVQRNGRLYISQDFARAVPAYSGEEFRDALAIALNRVRESKGLYAIRFLPDPSLRAAACATHGDTKDAEASLIGRSAKVMVFSLSQPDNLPEQARQAMGFTGARDGNLEVCFRPDGIYGSANFWVVLVLPT